MAILHKVSLARWPYRRLGKVLTALVLAVGLTGCLDIEQQVTIQSDGSVIIDVDQLYEEDMKDIAAFLDAIGRQGPQGQELRDGVCSALQTAAAKDPIPEAKITAKEFVFGGKYVCQNQLTLTSVSKLETAELPIKNILQVKNVGERKLLMSLNLSEIPDFAGDAQKALAEGLAGAPLPAVPDPTAPPPAGPDGTELWKKSYAASLAATRLFARNKYFQLTIKAPRIVETNGKIDADRTKAQFKYTWTEIVDMMYDPAKRKDKNLYAIVEY